MTNEDDANDATYIDRSVQTSPLCMEFANPAPSAIQPSGESAQDVVSTSLNLEKLTLSERLPDIPETDETGADEQPSLSSTTRALKRTHLPQRRPSSTAPMAKSTQDRVVSLPETVSEYSEKKTLRKIVKMRVVSVPVKSHKSSEDMPAGSLGRSPESEATLEALLPDHDLPSRIRVCSATTETPRTPSPPSSPDSLIIIGSESQISERFLRGSISAEGSPCSSECSNDGRDAVVVLRAPLNCVHSIDWAHWSRSPPRPIPALHGPSSLPYARCPS